PVAASVFLQRSRAHRDPPSFPTRRSSDLTASRSRARATSREAPRPEHSGYSVQRATNSPPSRASVTWQRMPARIRRAVSELRLRSEEHTSELQSLTNLVCRLLLEQKKLTT